MKKRLIKRIIRNIVRASKEIGALIEMEGAYTGNGDARGGWENSLRASKLRLKTNRAALNKLIFN